MAATCCALSRMACSVRQALVAMQRPFTRSTISDNPTNPSMCDIAGITVSRMCAIPASIMDGCAWIVEERANKVHPRGSRRCLRSDTAGAVHAAPPSRAWQGLVLTESDRVACRALRANSEHIAALPHVGKDMTDHEDP